jgi:hypothetical protein
MGSPSPDEDRPWLEPKRGVTRLPIVESPFLPLPVDPGVRVHLTLLCSMPQAGQVRLSVHDSSGRIVRTLLQGWMAAGEHAITWDQRDDRGRKVYAGHYRVRFEAAGRSFNQQVMLMP